MKDVQNYCDSEVTELSTAPHQWVSNTSVMPAKAGIQAFLLDSRQGHAGMTSRAHDHFILWCYTQ